MSEVRKIPQLRFPGFSDEWNNTKFTEVTNKISDGIHSTPKYDDNGEFYFVNGNNLVKGKIEISEKTKRLSETEYQKHKRELTVNTILLSINGTIGNLAFYENENIVLGKSACYINLRKDIPKYFYYSILQTSRVINYFDSELTGSTIKNLSLKTIKETSLIIPQIKEQKKIAVFLTSIDKKITQLQQKKTLLEQYKKGVMQKIFSKELQFKGDDGKDYSDWEEKRLEEVCKYYDGTHQTPKYVKEGIPFYSVEHITADQFEKTKFISKEVYEKENKRVKLEKGDILMTRIGSIGVAKYIDWDVHASFYVSLALIKPNKNCSAKYLSQLINSVYFQKELWKRTIHVAFPIKINLGEIGNCKVLLPCKEEQTKIAAFLSAIDAKIQLVNTQLENTQQFKKGLLQQMFV